MHRLLLTAILVILSTTLTFGQKTIIGKVLSQTTHEPIPYANIGIVNSNVGTISNFDGSFSIIIPQKLCNDTLTFSSLGFYKDGKALNLLESKKDYTILLTEKVTTLMPVVITAKRVKEKLFELGNTSSLSGNYEPDTTYSGRAVALLIDSKDFPERVSFPVKVKTASLLIFKNNFSTFKFRIRLNKYDSLTGKPGEDLLDQSIIEESSMSSGWLDFDLSNINFIAKGPFFVTFEQLIDLNDRTAIALSFRDIVSNHPEWLQTETVVFEGNTQINQRLVKGANDLPGTFIGTSASNSVVKKHTCFVRKTSLGEWIKVPMTIAATVSISRMLNSTSK